MLTCFLTPFKALGVSTMTYGWAAKWHFFGICIYLLAQDGVLLWGCDWRVVLPVLCLLSLGEGPERALGPLLVVLTPPPWLWGGPQSWVLPIQSYLSEAQPGIHHL